MSPLKLLTLFLGMSGTCNTTKGTTEMEASPCFTLTLMMWTQTDLGPPLITICLTNVMAHSYDWA
jgi:hypothetical protein